MQKRLLLGSIILFVLQFATMSLAQDIQCSTPAKVQTEKVDNYHRKNKLVADKSLAAFTIDFLHTFDNDVKIFLNDSIVFEDRVVTLDDGRQTTDTDYGFNYGSLQDIPNVRLIFDDEVCYKIAIKEKYKIIYLWLSSTSELTIRYSNNIYENL